LRGKGNDIFHRADAQTLSINSEPRNREACTPEVFSPLPTLMAAVAVNGRKKMVRAYSHAP
jgi:hypothetical protein